MDEGVTFIKQVGGTGTTFVVDTITRTTEVLLLLLPLSPPQQSFSRYIT